MPSPAAIPESHSYRIALRLAREALRALDPTAVAARCAVAWEPSGAAGAFRVRYLGEDFSVAMPDAIVEDASGAEASLWDAVLILHYLGSTGPIPASGEPIAFGDLPDGRFYDPAWRGRCERPLLRHFGACPDALTAAAADLDGRPWDRGDVSAAIRALPRLEVCVVLYRGDDEFPPTGSVVLAPEVPAFLSTEDIAVLGGSVVDRLARAAKRRVSPGS